MFFLFLKNKNKNPLKNEFDLFLPTAPEHGSCPGVWWIYPVLLHWRKRIFFLLPQQLLFVNSFSARVGLHVHFPSSVLGFRLALAWAGLCRLWVHIYLPCCVWEMWFPYHCSSPLSPPPRRSQSPEGRDVIDIPFWAEHVKSLSARWSDVGLMLITSSSSFFEEGWERHWSICHWVWFYCYHNLAE